MWWTTGEIVRHLDIEILSRANKLVGNDIDVSIAALFALLDAPQRL